MKSPVCPAGLCAFPPLSQLVFALCHCLRLSTVEYARTYAVVLLRQLLERSSPVWAAIPVDKQAIGARDDVPRPTNRADCSFVVHVHVLVGVRCAREAASLRVRVCVCVCV